MKNSIIHTRAAEIRLPSDFRIWSRQPAVSRTLCSVKQHFVFDSGPSKARTLGDFEALSLEWSSLSGHDARQEEEEERGGKERGARVINPVTYTPKDFYDYSSPIASQKWSLGLNFGLFSFLS